MIEEPRVAETTAQPAAVIRFTIPRDQIRSVMGPAMEELIATVTAQEIAPAGPLFSHHLRMDPEVFDFEVGVPVTAEVAPTGRVEPGVLPSATVLRTVYHGSYEGLPGAWREFDAWITASEHTPGSSLWERYVTGPESGSDPADWRTELNRPLAG